jgi:hypothetical protein
MKTNIIKENFFIVIVVSCIVLLVINLLLMRSEARLRNSLNTLREQLNKTSEIKRRVEEFYATKPYLQEEDFRRKIPPDVITPLEAMRQAGISILEAGVRGTIVVYSEEKQKAGKREAQTMASREEEEMLFSVGSRRLKPLMFQMEFTATYESLKEVLNGLSRSAPLTMVGSFNVERTAWTDLNINLILISFTELTEEDQDFASGASY